MELDEAEERLAAAKAEMRYEQARALGGAERAKMIHLQRATSDLQQARRQLARRQRADPPYLEQPALSSVAASRVFEAVHREEQRAIQKAEGAELDLAAREFTDAMVRENLLGQLSAALSENQALGALLQRESISQLEAELAHHKSHHEQLAQSKAVLQTLVRDLEEEIEAMLSIVLANGALPTHSAS